MYLLAHFCLICVILVAKAENLNSTGLTEASKFTRDFLKSSESLFDSQNELLGNLKPLKKQKNNPLSTENVPFWLALSNRALFLQYQIYKSDRQQKMRLDLVRKIPYLKRETNQCLHDPWSSPKHCSLKEVVQNLDFICLVDNSSNDFVKDGLDNFEAKTPSIHSNYQFFCWIIFGSYLLTLFKSQIIV